MKGQANSFVTDTAVKLLVAQATVEPNQLMRYVDASNRLQPEWRTLLEVVEAGFAFAGTTRNGWLAVDIDGHSPDSVDAAVASVLGLIDWACDVPVFVLDSGSKERIGRHVWAYVNDDGLISRLKDQVGSLPLAELIDVRDAGKKMRPPLGPHRHGGRSEPLDFAVEDFVAFLDEHPQLKEPLREANLPKPSLRDRLSLNAKAILDGHIHQALRNDGRVDRSRVDASIATSAVNAGFTEQEYLQLREHYPSQRAAEEPDPRDYLLRKFWSAKTLPGPEALPAQHRRRLNALKSRAEADPALRRRSRHTDLKVIAVFCNKSVVLGQATFPIALREIRKNAEIGSNQTVQRSLRRLQQAGYLRRVCDPDSRCVTYQLQLSRKETNLTCTGGVQDDWSLSGTIPPRTHPVFMWGMLPSASIEILHGIGEGTTRKALVEKLSGLRSRTTVYRLTKQLCELGILQLEDKLLT
ncbi:hypothetical protein OAM92_02845, partial [Acidimicrobiales bacterium]|nr:hypothetical protein [Acidimicrobiales bacterium]